MKRNKRKRRWILPLVILAVVLWAVFKNCSPMPQDEPQTPEPSDTEPLLKSVIIDPGHGGEGSPGCVYGDILEKDITLVLALDVKKRLEAAGVAVIMTREDDSFIDVSDRALMAEGADAFLSIHLNAVENDSVTEGIETWYSDRSNKNNKKFAQLVQDALCGATEAKDRGLRLSRELIVLRDTSIPSCLVEAGFLSSNSERALLTSAQYQAKIAQGIADGIIAFLRAL